MSTKKYKFAPALINDWLTNFYDPFVNLFHVGIQLQKKTLQEISLKGKQNFLDIGCGTGTLVTLVKKKYPSIRVIGVDPDKHVLKIAKQKTTKKKLQIEFVAAGAEELPFASNSFDYIVSSLAFHHLPTEIKKQALQEIHRALKSDGQFLLVDLGKPKNLFWKIILSIESLVEPKAYVKDNLEGKLPIFLEQAGFFIQEVCPPYLGIRFWKTKKGKQRPTYGNTLK